MLYEWKCICGERIVFEVPDNYPKNVRELRLYNVVYVCLHCGEQHDIFRVERRKPLFCQKCGKKLSPQIFRYDDMWIKRDSLPNDAVNP